MSTTTSSPSSLSPTSKINQIIDNNKNIKQKRKIRKNGEHCVDDDRGYEIMVEMMINSDQPHNL